MKSHTCPIPGCNFVFPNESKVGWYKHVGSISRHPHFHPEVTDLAARVELVKQEFPNFFSHYVPSSSGTFSRLDKENFDTLMRDVDSLRAKIQSLIRNHETQNKKTG